MITHYWNGTGIIFSTYAKLSGKLTFLTPWYAHQRLRIRGQKMLVFGKFCGRTEWIMSYYVLIHDFRVFSYWNITKFYGSIHFGLLNLTYYTNLPQFKHKLEVLLLQSFKVQLFTDGLQDISFLVLKSIKK